MKKLLKQMIESFYTAAAEMGEEDPNLQYELALLARELELNPEGKAAKWLLDEDEDEDLNETGNNTPPSLYNIH